jgi:hypothetical protein
VPSHQGSAPPSGEAWLHEIKHDGFRVMARGRRTGVLAALYNWQARYGDALAIVKRTMANGSANKAVAFPVLMASQTQQLARPREALADSYELVQRASSTAAGNVSKLAARFAAGTGELAGGRAARSEFDG